jgi:hypothetical protein
MGTPEFERASNAPRFMPDLRLGYNWIRRPDPRGETAACACRGDRDCLPNQTFPGYPSVV